MRVIKSINDDAPGFSFDSATRVLASKTGSEKPAAAVVYTLIYRAVDQNGARAYLSGRLEVLKAPTLPETIADKSFTVGEAVSITLPKATGGSLRYRTYLDYTLSPEIGGLTFTSRSYHGNQGTKERLLSGTANFVGSATMTYTATDTNGVSVSRNFTLTIAAREGAPASAPTVTALNWADANGDQYVILDWADVANAGQYVVQVVAADGTFPFWAVETRPDEGWLFFYGSRTDLGLGDGKMGQAVLGSLADGGYKVRVAAANGKGAGP